VNYLLDTNVVSELAKPQPASRVVAWLADADEDRLFISVITIAELRHGVERLAAGRRRERLHEWLDVELPERFAGRVLSIDAVVANAWGIIVAKRERVGRPIGAVDAFLAATALAHRLTFVTRNVSDFALSLTALVNPWL
jgi:hypothetical protein